MRMSPQKSFCIYIFLFFFLSSKAQVAIGTTTPDDGSALQIDSTVGALVPPRVTDAQMNAISTPLEGSIVYNTTTSALFLFSSGTWNDLTRPDLPSVVMRKDYADDPNNDIVNTGNNTYYSFPLNTANVTSIENSYFEVTGNGTIKILQNGNYMITAAFSVNNLPANNKKYIIGLYRNGDLTGYLVRGNVRFPDGTNEWGTSGVIIYTFNAGDSVNLSYVLNNDGNTLNARFFNIGIVKL